MKKINISRFEVVRDRDDATVCIFFMGRVIVPEGATLRLDGGNVVLECGDVELTFPHLVDEHIEWLANAPAIYVTRTLDSIHRMVKVNLARG